MHFRPSLTAAVLCLQIFPALAADLPASKPPLLASPETQRSWSGLYVGVHGALTTGDTELVDLSPAGFGDGWNVGGGAGGLQAGINHQLGTVVLGLETDYAFGAINGTISDSSTYFAGTPFQTQVASSITTEIRQWATLRPRLGVMTNNALIFVTAGLAAADLELRSQSLQTGLFGHQTYSSRTRAAVFGWAVGAGVEYGLTQTLSLKAEYLLVTLDLNSQGNQVDKHFYQGHVGRVGLNYRF